MGIVVILPGPNPGIPAAVTLSPFLAQPRRPCGAEVSSGLPPFRIMPSSGRSGGAAWRGRRRREWAAPPGVDQVQTVPLTVKPDGAVSLLVQVPWRPKEVLPPGLIEAL
jgi:hypothetical protein